MGSRPSTVFKMNETCLPRVLDQALKNLTEDYGITGWKIFSGISNATVSIKFGSHGQASMAEQITSYRRIPPSTIKRDINRIENFNLLKQTQLERASD